MENFTVKDMEIVLEHIGEGIIIAAEDTVNQVIVVIVEGTVSHLLRVRLTFFKIFF